MKQRLQNTQFLLKDIIFISYKLSILNNLKIKSVWISPKQIDSADQSNNGSKRKDMLTEWFFKRDFELFLG